MFSIIYETGFLGVKDKNLYSQRNHKMERYREVDYHETSIIEIRNVITNTFARAKQSNGDVNTR